MPSSAEVKKDALIAGLVEARKNILNAASVLPAKQRDEIFLGSWSVKDLLAHLIGWDYSNIQAVKAILTHKVPVFFSHYDKDWRTYNARLVTRYKLNNFRQLMRAVEKSHRDLITLLQSVPAEEFSKDRGLRSNGYKVTIARILQVELDDERVHHQQIVEFEGQVISTA